jgi:hypothetical protein
MIVSRLSTTSQKNFILVAKLLLFALITRSVTTIQVHKTHPDRIIRLTEFFFQLLKRLAFADRCNVNLPYRSTNC